MAVTINTNIVNDAGGYSLDVQQVKGAIEVHATIAARDTRVLTHPDTLVKGTICYVAENDQFYMWVQNALTSEYYWKEILIKLPEAAEAHWNKYLHLSSEGKLEWAEVGSKPEDVRMIAKTTAEWEALPETRTEPNTIYVYTDKFDYDDPIKGRINVPGIKVGDSNSVVLMHKGFLTEFSDYNISTITKELQEHVQDAVRHITEDERNKWNNKITCKTETGEDGELILNLTKAWNPLDP